MYFVYIQSYVNMSYVKAELNLTKNQAKTLSNAVESDTHARLKFTFKQLTEGGNHSMLLTNTQFNRIQKAIDKKNGITITLSKRQIASMQKGGFIGAIIASILGALAPTLFNRIFPSTSDNNSEGSGIMVPGSVPSRNRGGAILGANGDPANLHVVGNGIGQAKKKGRGMDTYLSPQSEKFQMLQ